MGVCIRNMEPPGNLGTGQVDVLERHDDLQRNDPGGSFSFFQEIKLICTGIGTIRIGAFPASADHGQIDKISILKDLVIGVASEPAF